MDQKVLAHDNTGDTAAEQHVDTLLDSLPSNMFRWGKQFLVALSGTAMSIAAAVPQDAATITSSGPPYTSVGINVPAGLSQCAATLSVEPNNPTQAILDCHAVAMPTLWATTITSISSVDCGPCDQLLIKGDIHGCPNMPTPTTTITSDAALTSYGFACATNAAESVLTLSVPTLAKPVPDLAYTPAALSIVYEKSDVDNGGVGIAAHASGECTATVSLAPTAAGQALAECNEERQGSKVYAATKTTWVAVDCAGCQTVTAISGHHGCPNLLTPTATSTVDKTTTTVQYRCFGVH